MTEEDGPNALYNFQTGLKGPSGALNNQLQIQNKGGKGNKLNHELSETPNGVSPGTLEKKKGKHGKGSNQSSSYDKDNSFGGDSSFNEQQKNMQKHQIWEDIEEDL